MYENLTEFEKELASFGNKVAIIAALEISNKIDEDKAYKQIKKLYKKLRKTHKSEKQERQHELRSQLLQEMEDDESSG